MSKDSIRFWKGMTGFLFGMILYNSCQADNERVTRPSYFDVNGDKRGDIVLGRENALPTVYVQQEDGTYKLLEQIKAERKAKLEKIESQRRSELVKTNIERNSGLEQELVADNAEIQRQYEEIIRNARTDLNLQQAEGEGK